MATLGPAITADPLASSRVDPKNPTVLIVNNLKPGTAGVTSDNAASLLNLGSFNLRREYPIDLGDLPPIQPGLPRVKNSISLDFWEMSESEVKDLGRCDVERVYVIVGVLWVHALPDKNRRSRTEQLARHFMCDVLTCNPHLSDLGIRWQFVIVDRQGVMTGTPVAASSAANMFTRFTQRGNSGGGSNEEPLAVHLHRDLSGQLGLSKEEFHDTFRVIASHKSREAHHLASRLVVLSYCCADARHQDMLERRRKLQRAGVNFDLTTLWDVEERLLFNALRFGELGTAVTNFKAVLLAVPLADSNDWCKRFCEGCSGVGQVLAEIQQLMFRDSASVATDLRVIDPQTGDRSMSLLSLLVYMHELQLVLLILAGERDKAIKAFKRNVNLVLRLVSRGLAHKTNPDHRCSPAAQVAIAFILCRGMHCLLQRTRPRVADLHGEEVTDLLGGGSSHSLSPDDSHASTDLVPNVASVASRIAMEHHHESAETIIRRRFQTDMANFTLMYRKAFTDLARAVGIDLPPSIHALSSQRFAVGALAVPEVDVPMPGLRVMLSESDDCCASALESTETAVDEAVRLTTLAAATFQESGRGRFALLLIRELADVLRTSAPERATTLITDHVLSGVRRDGAWSGLHLDAVRQLLRCHVAGLEAANKSGPEARAQWLDGTSHKVHEALLALVALSQTDAEKARAWQAVVAVRRQVLEGASSNKAAQRSHSPGPFGDAPEPVDGVTVLPWDAVCSEAQVTVMTLPDGVDAETGVPRPGCQTTVVSEAAPVLVIVRFNSALPNRGVIGGGAKVRLLLASTRPSSPVGSPGEASETDLDVSAVREPLHAVMLQTETVRAEETHLSSTASGVVFSATVHAEFAWSERQAGEYRVCGIDFLVPAAGGTDATAAGDDATVTVRHGVDMGNCYTEFMSTNGPTLLSVPDASADVACMSLSAPSSLHFFADARAPECRARCTIRMAEIAEPSADVRRWMQEHRSTASSRELAGYNQPVSSDDNGCEAPGVRICIDQDEKDAVECDDRRHCESAFVITGDQRHATRRGQARVRSWLRALAAGRDLRQASLSRRSSMRAPSSPPPRHWDDAPAASSAFGDGVGSSAATATDTGLVPQLSDPAPGGGVLSGDEGEAQDDGADHDDDEMTTIHFDNGCVVALPEHPPLAATAAYSEGRRANATVDALSSKIGHWRSEGCQLVSVTSRPPETAAFSLDVDVGVCASAVAGGVRSSAQGRRASAGALSSAAMDESIDPAEEAAVVRSEFVCSAACIGIRRRPRVTYASAAVTVHAPFDVRYTFIPVDEDVHCVVELQCRLGSDYPLVIQPGSVELVPENDALAPFITTGVYPNTGFVGATLTTRDTVSFGFVIEHFDTKSAALESSALAGYGVRFGCRYTHASVASLPKPVFNIFAGPTTRFSPRAAAPFRAKVGVAWRDVDDVQRHVPAHLRTFTVGARVPWVVRLWANTAAAEFEHRALVLSVSTSGSSWLHQGYSSKRFVVGDTTPSSPQSTTHSPLVGTGDHADVTGFDRHCSPSRRRHPDVELAFCTYATETGVLEAPLVLVMNPATETGIACEVQHDLTHVEVR